MKAAAKLRGWLEIKVLQLVVVLAAADASPVAQAIGLIPTLVVRPLRHEKNLSRPNSRLPNPRIREHRKVMEVRVINIRLQFVFHRAELSSKDRPSLDNKSATSLFASSRPLAQHTLSLSPLRGTNTCDHLYEP